MKKLLIFGALFILLAVGVFGDNTTYCSGGSANNIYWCDPFNSIASWTSYSGGFTVNNFQGSNRLKSTTVGADASYLNSLIKPIAGTNLSVQFLYQEPAGTYGYMYFSEDTRFQLAGDSYFNYWVYGTAGNDVNLRAENAGPFPYDYDFTANTWYKICVEMRGSTQGFYVNDTFLLNQTGIGLNVQNIVDVGFRADSSASYYDDVIIFEGQCNDPPTLTVTDFPPVVTVEYPTESGSYNASFNGSIVLNTDYIANCSINYTSTKTSNQTSHTFLLSNLIDGNYTIAYSCNYSNLWTNSSFWFFYDGNAPNSILYSPQNNEVLQSDFYVNSTFTDPNLYAVNVTITNSTGGIIYAYSSGAITNGSTTLNVADLISTAGWLNGSTYTLFREVTDSHTNIFKEKINTIKDDSDPEYNQIEYDLSRGDITLEYPKGMDILTSKEIDRFTLAFYSETIRGETAFNIQAPKMVYLPLSKYQGHFVIYDKNDKPAYWFDTEGLEQTRIEQIKPNKYRIYFIQDENFEYSRSLGGLNYVNWTTSFSFDQTKKSARIEPDYDLNILKGYCNISNFINVTYEACWFVNDINISCAYMDNTGENREIMTTPTSLTSSGSWQIGVPVENIADGDITTIGYCETGKDDCFAILNYTIPNQAINTTNNSLSIYWNIKNHPVWGTDKNVSIPAQCINNQNKYIALRIKSEAAAQYGYVGYCWNTTDFEFMFNTSKFTNIGARVIYDMNLTFNYKAPVPSSTEINIDNISINGTDYIYSCRSNDGATYSSWYNSSRYETGIIDIILRDEETLNIVDFTNVTVELINLKTNYSEVKITENGTLEFRDYPLTTNSLYEIRYYSENYKIRSKFYEITNFVNISDTLYMLNDTIGEKLDVLIRDFSLIGIPNATVQTQRFYANLSQWLTIAEGRTNILGSTRFYLHKDDVYYKFIVLYESNTIFSTSGEIIRGDVTTYRITTDISSVYTAWEGLQGDLTFSNSTGTPIFTFTYENKADSIESVTLQVFREEESGSMPLAGENTSTATADTITFEVDLTNYYHIAVIRLDYGDSTYNYLDGETADFVPPPPAERESFRPLILIVYLILFPALILGGFFISKRVLSIPVTVSICALIGHYNPLWELFPFWTMTLIIFGSIGLGYYLNKVNV